MILLKWPSCLAVCMTLARKRLSRNVFLVHPVAYKKNFPPLISMIVVLMQSIEALFVITMASVHSPPHSCMFSHGKF